MTRHVLLLVVALSAFLVPMVLQAQTAADADFDGDGTVGFSDFLAFAKFYGTGQAECDLSGNGSVDHPDFLIFSGFYGQQVEQQREKEIVADLRGGATMEFVYIPPGTFLMGSADTALFTASIEQPQHEVTISRGFYLGKYEVTQEQWEVVMDTRPWSGQEGVQEHPNHPAAYVSWEDVQEFIQKLNQAAGSEMYRLPTEAEWEYACRAGTTTVWPFGDDESRLTEYAWYYDNARGLGESYGHTVGTRQPNPWRLYDMLGNVWEWCQDWYSSTYYSTTPGADPQGPASGSGRVVRGGDFSYDAPLVRSAQRDPYPPSNRIGVLGFRVVRWAD